MNFLHWITLTKRTLTQLEITLLLALCSKASESKPIKLVTSRTMILPYTVGGVLCFNITAKTRFALFRFKIPYFRPSSSMKQQNSDAQAVTGCQLYIITLDSRKIVIRIVKYRYTNHSIQVIPIVQFNMGIPII